MRVLSSLFLLSISLYGYSQTAPIFNERRDYVDHVFTNLSQALTPTGFLLDRNAELGQEWEKFQTSTTNSVLDNQRLDNWFELYNYLNWGQTQLGTIGTREDILWPLYDDISKQLVDDHVVLPIMILDFDVNRMTYDALSEGHVSFVNNQYEEGTQPELGFEENHLYMAGILADTSENSQISIELNDQFILSNRGKTVDFIKLSINGNLHTLYSGDILDLEPFLITDNEMLIELQYTDGEIISNTFNFTLAQRSTTRTADEEVLFDETGTFNGPTDLVYGIKFGCGNTDLRKPVIFISGLGPATNPAFLIAFSPFTDNAVLYDRYNIDGMMDELLLSGHDVVVARFVQPVGDLRDEGERIIDLLNTVNTRKNTNNSYIENIIISYSSGALATKYALDKMEFEHLANQGPHHHTKLYASFEGEHQGANIPIGPQALLYHMANNSLDPSVSALDYMANSAQAKQLLKYYRTSTPTVPNGAPISAGQGPHQMRIDFLETMEITYATGKQIEKYGYTGYPAFTRNISITNGSRKTDNLVGPIPITENYPFQFDYGHLLFKQTNTNKFWQVNLATNSSVGSLVEQVYNYKEFNIWGTLQYSISHFTSLSDLYDKSPGGFLSGDNNLIFKVMDKAYSGGVINGSPDSGGGASQFRATSFTPVVSSLDIEPSEYTSSSRQFHYDLQDEGLMRFEFNNQIPNDFYGYPVLGHPTNHYDITPFQAIYADEFNETHVSSFVPTAISNGLPTAWNNSVHPKINDFLFSEIQYKNVYLQNQQVGWNTNGADYRADYEAQESITLGEKVTPSTDIAPYEIWDNGIVNCKAGNEISIKNGFHAMGGSEFHAEIISPQCIYLSGGPSAMSLPDDQTTSYNQQFINKNDPKLTNNISEEHQTFFMIVPNPNNGNFAIMMDDTNTEKEIQIIDLSGKIKYSSILVKNESLNLSLEKGVYLVRISDNNDYMIKKLVIQ